MISPLTQYLDDVIIGHGDVEGGDSYLHASSDCIVIDTLQVAVAHLNHVLTDVSDQIVRKDGPVGQVAVIDGRVGGVSNGVVKDALLFSNVP